MGGGILPIARSKNGDIYLLFSRERVLYNNYKDKGKWCDFGGSKDGNETQEETAIRECAEESSGILGDQNDIRKLIKNHLEGVIYDKCYSIWIVEVRYNRGFPRIFDHHFKDALKNNIDLVKENNGLYEKDKLEWIKLSTLKRKINRFRPFYKRFIPKIIKILCE